MLKLFSLLQLFMAHSFMLQLSDFWFQGLLAKLQICNLVFGLSRCCGVFYLIQRSFWSVWILDLMNIGFFESWTFRVFDLFGYWIFQILDFFYIWNFSVFYMYFSDFSGLIRFSGNWIYWFFLDFWTLRILCKSSKCHVSDVPSFVIVL